MIQAYPERASLDPGDVLVLRISTDHRRFRVHFFRWIGALELMDRSDWLRGEYAPPRPADQAWDWPPYRFSIPDNWPSAVYLAYCETAGGPPPRLYMPEAAALFVVRGRGTGGLLFKLPLTTYHAYNYSGNSCFYQHPLPCQEPPGARVSLQRPGGGTGGIVWGAPDHYDQSTPRQCFAHWDAPFIAWLRQQHFPAEFCTDLDIHADPDLCQRYRLLVSAGHDEYWSEPARDHVEAFIGTGGNVAFFAANVCWWRIHLNADLSAMVCHQGGPAGARDRWSGAGGVNRPEDSLSGLSYRHGGGWWDGPRTGTGYRVEAPDHWAFAGTGLHSGQSFGTDSTPPLVGYECDGAPLAQIQPARIAAGATDCGTPSTLRLLAVSPLHGNWQELPDREQTAARTGIHAACMSVYERNGTVFSAGTTDWAQALVQARDPHIPLITRNVLRHLLEGPCP